MEMRF